MFRANQSFITQTKLAELRRQRSQLLQAYDELENRVEESADAITRLRRLYEGLQEIRFARQPLHPDVQNLDLLLRERDYDIITDELIEAWITQLERQLASGRLRAEFVYIFGALLEQWITQTRQPTERERLADIVEGLVDQIREAAPVDDISLLDDLLTIFDERDEEILEDQREEIEERLTYSVTEEEIRNALLQIRGDIYRPVSLRRQASDFLSDAIWMKELADALTILLHDIDNWHWRSDGMTVQPSWTRNKWRLFLNEDLPAACLLMVLGFRWQKLFDHIFSNRAIQRLLRLRYLENLNAPTVIIENEKRLLEQANQRNQMVQSANIWVGFDGELTDEQRKTLERWDYNSILAQREAKYAELRSTQQFGAYGGEDGYSGGMSNAVMVINAEIQLARTAFPDNPFYVVKFDLADFYTSISHDALLMILERLGLAEREIEFFRRYLKVPLQHGDAILTMQRGVSNDHILSHLLAEVLLRLLDQHIQRTANVLVVRVVDDICLLTPNAADAINAWEAAQAFCAACGLKINADKTGSVAIGGERPAGLPQRNPTWMLIQLDDDGNWRTYQEGFNTHLQQTRESINDSGSIISRVSLFNANLKYLMTALAIRAPLGDVHRADIGAAIARFHHELFAADTSLVDGLRAAIKDDFLEASATLDIPEAWLYWPITAGGLGVTQTLLQESLYSQSYDDRWQPDNAPSQREVDWQHRNNDWANFYRSLLNLLSVPSPKTTNVMETLVRDFIQRGSTITAGRQSDLAPYWRWILYIYGQQILDIFGTFRFLITELVPMQLIVEQRMDDTSLTTTEDADEIPF